MEIIVGKFAGFCFGVKRAVEMAEKESEDKSGEIYTLGPIIHNEKVISYLKEKGIEVLEDENAAKIVKNATVIIRSHGVSPNVYEILKNNNCKIVDATCPFVKKIHNLVNENSQNGEMIVIVGNKNHPEVQGIIGYINGEYTILESEEDALTFIENKELDERAYVRGGIRDTQGAVKVCVFSQTTFNSFKYKNIIDIISKKYYNMNVFTTICNSTEERQHEAFEMSKKCTKMLILGSKTSSNTKKLFDIASKNCDQTFFVDDISEIKKIYLNENDVIGVCAGASTPSNFIGEVVSYARTKF